MGLLPLTAFRGNDMWQGIASGRRVLDGDEAQRPKVRNRAAIIAGAIWSAPQWQLRVPDPNTADDDDDHFRELGICALSKFIYL